MAEDKDDNKKSSPAAKQRVVVTQHPSKKTGDPNIPENIKPKQQTKVVDNPVDSGVNPAKYTQQSATSSRPKSSLGSSIPDEIKPKIKTTASAGTSSVASAGAGYASTASAAAGIPAAGGAAAALGGPPPVIVKSQGAMVATMALILSLLALIGGGGIGYYAFINQQHVMSLASQIDNDTSSVKALRAETEKSLQQMYSLESKHESQQQRLSDLSSQVEKAQSQLVGLSGKSEWVLAEANFLVGMANERLQSAADIKTAAKQLKTADQKISGLGDPSLSPVRQAIANSITKLETFVEVDKEGIWHKLASLEDPLTKLQFKTLPSPDAKSTEEGDGSKPASESSNWKQALRSSWGELKGLIRVTRYDQDVAMPILSQQDQEHIRRMLLLSIEQARWATVHGNQNLYDSSLENLNKWVKDFFEQSSTRDQVIATVDSLTAVQINQLVPDISEAQEAIVQALNTRQTYIKPFGGSQ